VLPTRAEWRGGELRIAILGWGSLLWEVNPEFDRWHECWQTDGPILKIEFSRISTSRSGALTLVIDEEHGTSTPVAWCLSKRAAVDDVVCDLRSREGTTHKNISHIDLRAQPADHQRGEPQNTIAAWARSTNVDSVVWTALESNFVEKRKQPYSVAAAIAYLKTLDPAGKAKAAEYIWRAPAFVRTDLRLMLQGEPWFSAEER
jgi:hypothetical protein